MSLLARIPLVLLVAISATLELVLNRIGTNVLRGAASRTDPLFRLVDLGGLFSFYLTGLLALIAFSWAVVVLIRDQRLLRPPDRMVFTVVSALFLPLAAMGLTFSLPHRVAPHLNTSFGLLLLVLVVAFLRHRAPLRAKLGLFYLAAPLLLHVYWLMTQQIPLLNPRGDFSELPSKVFVTAEHLVVVGAFAAFLFFAPFPRLINLLEPVPMVIAVVVAATAAVLTRYQYIEAAQAAYYGLGINLPPPSAHGAMHLAALFFFVLTLGALVMRDSREREVALGLYLVAVSGFQLQLPYHFLLTLLGVMQIARGSLDPVVAQESDGTRPSGFPDPESWKQYLQRLAAACSLPPETGEAVVLQNGNHQLAHLRGQREGLAFTLRLLQRGGHLERLEATVGRLPKDPAPIAVGRRANLRGGRVSQRCAGPRVKLHLPAFDEQFELHYGADGSTDLLREQAEPLQHLMHGWLGIWPGEGVHYVSAPGSDGWPIPLAEVLFSAEDASVEEMVQLMELLDTLARRAEVK